MMVRCYHFIPGNKLDYLDSVSSYRDSSTFNTIFDVEDAVKDIHDQSRSRKLKDSARENLLEFITTRDSDNHYVRVNNPTTNHWNSDREFLRRTQPNSPNVVVPKAENLQQVEAVQGYVGKDAETVPLIENESGVENLDDIVRNTGVNKVIFGHHDYFHDKDVFPIPDSAVTSEQYRDVMQNMMASLKGTKVEYIDGIHPELTGEGLNDVLQYLHTETPDRPLGKLSVHPNHADRILSFTPTGQSVQLQNDDAMSDEKRTEHAREVIGLYEGCGDSITRLEDRYVSPQMYEQAKTFLSNKESL